MPHDDNPFSSTNRESFSSGRGRRKRPQQTIFNTGPNSQGNTQQAADDRVAIREAQIAFDLNSNKESAADNAFLRDRGLLREKDHLRTNFLNSIFSKFESTGATQDQLNQLLQTSKEQVGIGDDQLAGLFNEGGEGGAGAGFLGQLLSKQRDAFNVGQDRNQAQLRNFLIREGGAGSLSSGKAGLTNAQFLSDSNAALGASQADTISNLFPSLIQQSTNFFNKSSDKRFSNAPDINNVLSQLGSI